MMKKVLYSILVIGMFTMPLVAKDLKGVLVNEKQKPIAGMKQIGRASCRERV